MQRRCDTVNNIMSISSSLKCFINIVFPKSTLKITLVLWTSRHLCARNSGYYAIKQFWNNAELISAITKSKEPKYVHYCSVIRSYVDEDEDEDEVEDEEYTKPIPKCFLTEITNKQSLQLVQRISAELFPSIANTKHQNRNFWLPEFLLQPK